jgi:hypothetical protein
MDHVEFVDRNSLVSWLGDRSSEWHGHDHSHVGFSERIDFGDGESGRVFGNTVADESVVRFVG